MVGRKTEKTRMRRSIKKLQQLMRKIRHHHLKAINQGLQGHYAYYGLGGNHRSLWAICRIAEKYWCKMLKSRSRKSLISLRNITNQNCHN